MRLRIFKSRDQRRQFLMIIFLLMILATVFAFLFGYPFMSAMSGEKVQTKRDIIKKFSKQKIFNTSFNKKEEAFLINHGFTIATYYYKNSPEFFELEQLVNRLKRKRLVVEKIKGNETKVELVSGRGSETVRNLTEKNIISSLCEVLYQPPPECAS